jgi:hypothetical protein
MTVRVGGPTARKTPVSLAGYRGSLLARHTEKPVLEVISNSLAASFEKATRIPEARKYDP